MQPLLYGYFLLFFIAACGHSNDDISGTSDMGGKIYLHNPYDSFPRTLKKDQYVLLQRETDQTPSSFMFSTTTDSTGRFNFKYLYGDRIYKVYAETRSNTRLDSNILFSVVTVSNPEKNLELVMHPDQKSQNGLYITCVDGITPVAGLIPGDSIYIYTSSVLAAQDSAIVSGSGASYKFLSNVHGQVLKMNLPPGIPLYINAACTYGGKRYKSVFNSLTLDPTGIKELQIKLIQQ
jgi:hypothetical protein